MGSIGFGEIEGISFVNRGGTLEAPFIGIVGSLHGNERCGLEVIQGLRNPSHPLVRRLKRGTLVLIHGNPAATEQRRRHTVGGTDLNRIFDYRFLEEVPKDAWTIEHHRAVTLKPVLETLDMLLDLHSSTEPSEPFVITDERHLERGVGLGCRWVTFGWDGPGLLMDRVILGRFQESGRPAFSVECGQHQAPETFAFAWEVACRFLEAMDLLEGESLCPGPEATVVRVLHRVSRPAMQFSFSRPFVGFDRVDAGECLGEGGGVRLVAAEEFRLLLPNPHVALGEDMFYLGSVVTGR